MDSANAITVGQFTIILCAALFLYLIWSTMASLFRVAPLMEKGVEIFFSALFVSVVMSGATVYIVIELLEVRV